MMKLYRCYRYLYTFSSFIGFLFLLLNSPQRLALILKFAGFSHTTIFSQNLFKDPCNEIEDAAIASNPGGYNSTVTQCTEKIGQYKIELLAKGEHADGRHINGKLQYSMNNDTLMRWYCECHRLRPLSLLPCSRGGLLFLTYCRAYPSKARRGEEEPASWQLLGSHKTRTSFLAYMGKPSHTSNTVQSYLASGPKKREFVPWMGPFESRGRPLETVVLDNTLRDSIIGTIDFFMDNKEALLKGGHRHQYGMLWIGPPGCGKTSLAEAIAYKYRCATYTFPLGDSTLTDSELVIMYLKMGQKAIAIYDDIDRVQLGEKQITENGLFKLLDGFVRQDQTLLNILICNDEKKVPSALRRKGRVDKEYYFSLASRAQVKQIFLLCNVWNAEETQGLDLNAMAEEFAKGVPDNSVPPADIAVYIKEAKNPKEAVEHVDELTAKIENAEERRIVIWRP